MRPEIDCECCGKRIYYDESGFLGRCARITRGDFRFHADGEYDAEHENVKFERFICSRCFLEDPDLCAFFNKIGLRVR
jgi:hypothetical protein